MKQFLSKSNEETKEIARQYACSLQRGDIVLLIGGIGVGKTEFTRGITEVFNCDSQLCSPTYTILNIYKGSLKNEEIMIYHFDWFRLNDVNELYNIGFEEYLFGNGVSVVEWADKFPEQSPKSSKRVEILKINEFHRLINL